MKLFYNTIIVSEDSFAETVASSDNPCETSVVWEQPAGRSSDTRRIIVIVFFHHNLIFSSGFVNDENVAVPSLIYITTEFPSSTLYIDFSSGYASSIAIPGS